MDWSVVGVAIGAVLGYGASWLNQREQRKDRKSDREAALDETHRSELRQAYVEFTGSYSRMLDMGALFASNFRIWKEHTAGLTTLVLQAAYGAEQRKRYDDAVVMNAALAERSRVALHNLTEAGIDANTRASKLLMLEDDPERANAVRLLLEPPLDAPQSVDDVDRFVRDIRHRRGLLDALNRSMEGAFAATAWARRGQRLLPPPRAPALVGPTATPALAPPATAPALPALGEEEE